MSLKGSYANCKVKVQTAAFAREQMVFQDIRQNDSDGVIKWFQPWAGACLLAGSGARRFALKDGLAGWKAWARPVTGHPPGLPDDGFRSIRHGSRPRVESEAFQAWAWSHLNCPPKAQVSKERGK